MMKYRGLFGGARSCPRTSPSRSSKPCASTAFRPIWRADVCAIFFFNREPADFDVATSATPGASDGDFSRYVRGRRAIWSCAGASYQENGSSDGRSTRNSESKTHAVEVATFRSDLGYSDGRHPDEVRFSQDPRRRCGTPRLHHQRHDARSGERRSARFRWRAQRIWKPASFALLATRSGVLRKTNCACCGRFVLRRASNMKSKRRRWRRSSASRARNSGGLARAGSR